ALLLATTVAIAAAIALSTGSSGNAASTDRGPTGSLPSTTGGRPARPDPRRGVIDDAFVGHAGGAKVVVLGDSLTVTIIDEIRTGLRGRQTIFAARFGEGWGGGPLSSAY